MTMQHVDVAIVGGGIFGLSAAWACAVRGMSVRVFEARTPGSGASGGLVGALSPHMPEKWNPKKLFQLQALVNAGRFWEAIEAVSGQTSGYARTGRVLPLRSERLRDQAHVRAQEVPLLWQGQAEWNVVDAVDGFGTSPCGYVHETLSARIRPRAAIASLATALRKKGVEIVGDTPVADPASLAASHRIIAAGAACASLTPDLPEGFWTAVKGQSALLDVRLPDQMPLIYDGGIYVVPHGAAGTAVGSTSERTWDDPTAVTDALHPVVEQARALVPALKDAPVRETWAGLRPRARLPDPVAGQLRNGTWIMGGGFKVGLALGPELGRQLAAIIDGQDVTLPRSFTLDAQQDRCT